MAQGVPSTNQVVPFSREALQLKSKFANSLELPGLFYSQYTPTAATISSGTVTNDGMSMVGALQRGLSTASTASLGGDAAVTFSSSSGLLASFTTSSFMPTTLNYDQMPVQFVPSGAAVLPTGILPGVTYYWQWVSATTGRLSLTQNGSVIPYTDAGSGTIYCQAATQYWGSPWMNPGFLNVSDVLNQSIPQTVPNNGCQLRIEVLGHKIGTTTNNFTIKTGLVSAAGTWTALTSAGTLAAVAAGPFPFSVTTDIVIQQYGTASATTGYVPALVKAVQKIEVYSAAGTATTNYNIWAKTTSIDLTQAYAVDVRYLAATPAVGEYCEPLVVRMTAFN